METHLHFLINCLGTLSMFRSCISASWLSLGKCAMPKILWWRISCHNCGKLEQETEPMTCGMGARRFGAPNMWQWTKQLAKILWHDDTVVTIWGEERVNYQYIEEEALWAIYSTRETPNPRLGAMTLIPLTPPLKCNVNAMTLHLKSGTKYMSWKRIRKTLIHD